ncbi:MAG: ATP-dependent helicase [Bacteroidetes bacterium]|nr:ATP-dependent helicase [Bacteroidota bacterium]
MNKYFIIAISEHRKFGLFAQPYIIKKDNSFYTIQKKVTLEYIENYEFDFSEKEKQIIRITDEYSDRNLLRNFCKKKQGFKEFYTTASQELITKQIRPYIEKRIVQIVELIKGTSIKIYKLSKNYNNIYDSDELFLNKENAQTVFNIIKSENETKYFISIQQDDEKLTLTNKAVVILTNSPCSLIQNNKIFTFTDVDGKKLAPFFNKTHILIPKNVEKKWFETFAFNSIKKYKINASGFEIIEIKPEIKPILSIEHNLKKEPVLVLKFQYNDKTILSNYISNVFINFDFSDSNYKFYKIYRDKKLEINKINKLIELGFESKDNMNFYLSTQNKSEKNIYQLINFINNNQKELTENNFTLNQNYFEKKYYLGPIKLNLHIKNNNDWFDIYGTIIIEGTEIPFIKLIKHILSGKREYKLPSKEIIIIPEEWFSKYKEIFLFSKKEKETIKIKKYHFQLLKNKIEGIDKKYLLDFEDLLNQKKEQIEQPKLLQAKLRPYQTQGLTWMYHLQKNNFGGCLADDMGLGKTIQTLSLLLKSRTNATIKQKLTNTSEQLYFFNDDGNQRNTSLIIMPSSLIHNWVNEIIKFAPQLRVYKYIGNNRTKNLNNFGHYDIVLTTYGVVRNDIEFLKKYNFSYIILDESQIIKNPKSKTYSSVLELNSENKLVLTGTPIENSLIDLWSQINFINRGLLGNLNFFKTQFVIPIEKDHDDIQQDKLKNLIHPFILRRTKQEVAKDLPDLTEQTLYCKMTVDQKHFYEEEKSKIRNLVLESIEQKGVEKSKFVVLQALIKLRQLANHPVLVNKDYESDSGKFDDVVRNIENVISENHKVLIFSSFTKHLDLFAKYLDEKNTKYSILTGKSKDRERIIKVFQDDKNTKIFLISLKAGGVGLNLTAADYVFLLDPWWNPAAENQAISRAHRIGQNKKVFVYRFISSETIEEKIIQLQKKKSQLANLFINSNNPFKKLTVENLVELFD